MHNNEKEFVKEITNIEENFANWYTDIVLKADLADYTDVKGFIAIKPYGFAIWENIKEYADNKFKQAGVENIYLPLLIPEGLLNKEKEHVEGFAPEVAWVTRRRAGRIGRKALHTSYVRDYVFCTLFKMGKFMERFA